MGQKPRRANAVRAGLFGIVLLGGLALPQPSGAAPSCFACIVSPEGKTTSTCGDPLTEDVVGTSQNVTGEMIATAVANLGILGGAAITFATTPGALNQQVFATVLGCNGFNGAVFTLDDVVVSGLPGSDGQPVAISFNIAVSGTLSAVGSGLGSEASFSVFSTFPLFTAGTLYTNNSGGFSATGMLSSIAGPGAIDTVVTTPSGTVVVGTPFSFSLGMGAASFAGWYGIGFGPAGDSMGRSDFSQAVGFPCTTQVANLPDGFTLNSVSGVIVDNQFQLCPTPPSGSSGTSPASSAH